MFNQSIN